MMMMMIAFLLFVALAMATSAVMPTHWRNVTYHLLGLPYSESNSAFSMDSFSLKVVRLCRILNDLGVDYFVYANANTDPACRNVVEIFSTDERVSYYGPDSAWREGGGYFDQNTISPGAVEWRKRVIATIDQRKRSAYDFVLATFGSMHQPIGDTVGLYAIETGVGYEQQFAYLRILESYAWLAHNMRSHADTINEVSFYSAVIPMCYYADEFGDASPLASDPPYIAYVGRINEMKGVEIALHTLAHLPDNYRLKVAGTGSMTRFLDRFTNCSDRVDVLGVLDADARTRLLRGARALMLPSLYVEPFGSVVVEAMFVGTPAITTDHAGMYETVRHGVTGFRCRSLSCFVSAVHQSAELDRMHIGKLARANFACGALQLRLADYFQDAVNLRTAEGWSSLNGEIESMLAPFPSM